MARYGGSGCVFAIGRGLPTDRFFFEGFLPPRGAARRARIADLADLPATLIFFEAGPRACSA
jgi:16S rRNA (cytidine1402-2'-O)-methyltransferase